MAETLKLKTRNAEIFEAMGEAMLEVDQKNKFDSSINDLAKAAYDAAEPYFKGVDDDYKTKYEKLKEFVRGKWKGDCSECAALANEIFNKENNG